MAHKSAAELNKELFDKLNGIKLNNPAGIFGVTSHESILQNARKRVADLGSALAADEPYEATMRKYEEMVGGIDTAGISGIISETELTSYYKLVDDIWAAIERKN